MTLSSIAKRSFCLLAAALFTAVVLCHPAAALAADASVAYSEENGEKTYYATYADAQKAASSGKVIVLTADWILRGPLSFGANQNISIEMNGHSISLADDVWTCVFKMGENSTLTLSGKKDPQHDFSFKGYNSTYASSTDMTIKSGGLVTKGEDGCIELSDKCKLNLDNVAIAGNGDGHTGSSTGAGVFADGSECVITMKNNATIAHNRTKGRGGAIFLEGSECEVNMEASSIVANYSETGGGGIYSNGSKTNIFLTKGSKIDSNYADYSGGGVYFNYSFFKLESPDGTGVISNNSVPLKAEDKGDQTGGGIYVESRSWGQNEGRITNITISGNKAYNAAGVYLKQEYTVLTNCTITGNEATNNGGGIYNNNDKNTITSCTITGNKVKNGAGAGILCLNDTSVWGKTIIEGNARGDGSADDAFLYNKTFSKVYLKGTVDVGSCVGVRTDSTGARKLVEDLTTYIEGTYFLDLPQSLHPSYRSGDNELWQEKGSCNYLVTINGKGSTRYAAGETVTVNGATYDKSKAFVRWLDSSTGITLTSEQKKSKTLSFKMKTNDVHLSAQYIDRATRASVKLAYNLEAGYALPTKAYLKLDGAATSTDVEVTWREKQANGTYTVATGTAKYNTTYVAEIAVPEDASAGVAFAYSGLTTTFADADGADILGTASVDQSSGTFYVSSKEIVTAVPEVSWVQSARITVDEGITENELRAAIPTKAVADVSDGNKIIVNASVEDADLSALLKDGKIGVPSTNPVLLKLSVTTDEATVPSDVTFAVWVTVNQMPSYTVTFETGDTAVEVPSQTVKAGQVAMRPSDPTRADYVFQGWYTDQDCKNAFDFATPITVNKTLWAKWEKKTAPEPETTTYNVKFHTGAGTSIADQTVVANDKVVRPVDPVRDDYAFDGWFTDEACTSVFEFSTPVTKNLDLYAKWTKIPQVEKPTLNFDEGDYETTSMMLTASCGTADAAIKYKLSQLDDGEWSGGDEKSYTANGIELTCAKGAERLYMLEIWAEKDGALDSDHDFVFYQLCPKGESDQMVTIKITYTDTSRRPSESSESFTITKGTPLSFIAPYKEGYSFDSWSCSDESLDFDETYPVFSVDEVEDDLELTATYCPVVTQFNLGLTVPVEGKALDRKINSITATAAGANEDMSEFFDLDTITWSPLSPDGKAAYSTAYTLKIPMAEATEEMSSLMYELSELLTVTFNGTELEGIAAWFDGDETGAALYVSFPATGAAPDKKDDDSKGNTDKGNTDKGETDKISNDQTSKSTATKVEVTRSTVKSELANTGDASYAMCAALLLIAGFVFVGARVFVRKRG